MGASKKMEKMAPAWVERGKWSLGQVGGSKAVGLKSIHGEDKSRERGEGY